MTKNKWLQEDAIEVLVKEVSVIVHHMHCEWFLIDLLISLNSW